MRELRITNLEPLILDPGAGIANERGTLDYIPASRIRGAVFGAIQQLAPGVDAEELFGYKGCRWSPGWPANGNWEPCRPAPKCISKYKGDWVGWYSLDGQDLIPAQPEIEMNMSVGRHYGRRAHRRGALYSRSAISPNQHFVAWVDSDKLATGVFELSMGTRHSVNGRCSIEVSESGGPGFQIEPDTNDVVLMLLADAIIPARSGGYLRGLDAKAFTEILECDVEVDAAYSSWHPIGAWSGQWKLPRESAIAIQAGSVWQLRVGDPNALKQLLSSGIGTRTYEGFGWAEIVPKHGGYIKRVPSTDGNLSLTAHVRDPDAAEPAEATSARWPGLDDVELGMLQHILEEAVTEVSSFTVDDRARRARELQDELNQETHKSSPEGKEIFRLKALLERLNQLERGGNSHAS